MRDRQTCVGCGKKSPETETNYTLISAQFGWRLTRVKNSDGSLVIEWRCPTCWRDYKRTRSPSSPDATAPAPPPSGAPVLRPGLPRPPTPFEIVRQGSSTPSPAKASRPSSSPPTVKRPSAPTGRTPSPPSPSTPSGRRPSR